MCTRLLIIRSLVGETATRTNQARRIDPKTRISHSIRLRMSIKCWTNMQPVMMYRDVNRIVIPVIAQVIHVCDIKRYTLLGQDGRARELAVVRPNFCWCTAGVAKVSMKDLLTCLGGCNGCRTTVGTIDCGWDGKGYFVQARVGTGSCRRRTNGASLWRRAWRRSHGCCSCPSCSSSSSSSSLG